MRQSMPAPIPEWQPHQPPAPRARCAQPEASPCTTPDKTADKTPDTALDICLLLHNRAAPRLTDPFQLALRGFCTLPWPVSCATLSGGRLDLRIDGAQVQLCQITLAHDAPVYRPALARAALLTGRLSYLLTHHDMALRLRIDATAAPDLVAAIRHLLLCLTRPKAVITYPQRLVLSLSEYEHLSRDDLAQPLLTTPLQLRIPRHTRPHQKVTKTDHTQPLTPNPPRHRASLFRRPDDRPDDRPDSMPAAHTAPDPVETLLAEYHDAHLSRALRSEFRTPTHWKWIAPPGTNHRVALLQSDTAEADQAKDMLICDAVMLSRRGRVRHHLAPILLATLVALTQLAWLDLPANSDANHDSTTLTDPLAYSA